MKKIIFYYIRFALCVHATIFALLPFYFLNESFQSKIWELLFWVLLCISFPVFLILPGIIYDGKFNYSYHGFTVDQIRYSLFLGLTLGFGPSILYLLKYDKKLKEMVEESERKKNT